MSDFTLRNNPNLIVGGTSLGTHHLGEGLVLQEQFGEVRRTYIKVTNELSASTCRPRNVYVGPLLYSRPEPCCADSLDAVEHPQHLALEGELSMSQERSMLVNPGEVVSPTMQPTSGGTLRPPLALPSFGDGNIPSHTQGTLRTKDEHGEGPLRGSPFIQEIQDAPIPSHFRLSMLEAYDGSSNLMEHVAVFHAQMTLYGMSDAIVCWAFPMTLRGSLEDGTTDYLPPPFTLSINSQGKKGLLKTLNPLRSRAKDWDRRYYCCFHRDYGHDIKECYDLENKIEDPIHLDYLDWYIVKPRKPSLRPKGPMERHIDVIVGGLAAGGVSSSARKAYAHAEVQKRPRPRYDPGFTFESESEYPDHDDTLAVTARIANACVRRIMIDIGSSVEMLYLDAFHKLGMTNRDLIAMTSTLTGFTDDAITPKGIVTLPVTFSDKPRTKTLMVDRLHIPSQHEVLDQRRAERDQKRPTRIKAMLPCGNNHT
ncbi:hypothetical protein GW17_00042048 [Ensete ventricosum]|nr:hypothetical protein GW17_00042048 [Ensete ventricosum]